MSARYEISEGELDVLAITGPEGTRYIDGEEIEARVIRQQSADIAELRAELNRERETNAVLRRDLAEPPPDIQELALKKCGHFEIVAKLRADLAAAVAERNKRIAELEAVANHAQAVVTVCERDYKDRLLLMTARAEQAEARLSAIDSAPVVAWLCTRHDGSRADATCRESARDDYARFGRAIQELIAKPAKD